MGPRGVAALHELRAFATEVLSAEADADAGLELAARLIRSLPQREREGHVARLRREVQGARISVPVLGEPERRSPRR